MHAEQDAIILWNEWRNVMSLTSSPSLGELTYLLANREMQNDTLGGRISGDSYVVVIKKE